MSRWCRPAISALDKRIAISGSGNVALHAADKALEKGAKVITLSDSDGFVHLKDEFDADKLAFARDLKENQRGRIAELAKKFEEIKFHKGKKPWGVTCDIAMPCATQNELDEKDAKALIKNGVSTICEGSNMPTTLEAMQILRDANVLHSPGKASNAGGVAVSGLEQSQNSMRISWPRQEVDNRLKEIMHDIHQRCVEFGEENGKHNYIDGANIAGFKKVADAMLAYGVV